MKIKTVISIKKFLKNKIFKFKKNMKKMKFLKNLYILIIFTNL